MPERQHSAPDGFTARRDQPLIGIPDQSNGRELVHYFTDEADLEAALPPASVQRALDLLGAWQDIDSADALDELDRIRHESPPTPPIDLDV
jgi:hypothetical protein